MSDTTHTMRYNDEEVTFKDQFSILDCLEEEGLNPDYSCRSGSCETCKLKVVSGTFEWIQPPMMGMEEGTVLACSAIPTSDMVLTSLDD